MKTICFIISIISLVALQLSAQEIWEYTTDIDINYSETLVKSELSSDGFIYSVGSAVSAERVSNFYITKRMADSGDLVWDKEIIMPGEQYGQSIAVSADGVYVVGIDLEAVNANSKGIVVKLDLDGIYIWEKKWSTDYNAEFNDIHVTASGKVILAGVQTIDVSDATRDALLLSVNSDGSLFTEIHDNLIQKDVESIEEIIEYNSNSIVLVTNEDQKLPQMEVVDLNNFEINKSYLYDRNYFDLVDLTLLGNHDLGLFADGYQAVLVLFDEEGIPTAESELFVIANEIVGYSLSGNEYSISSYSAYNDEFIITQRSFDVSSLSLIDESTIELTQALPVFSHLAQNDESVFYTLKETISNSTDAVLYQFDNSSFELNWRKISGKGNGPHDEFAGNILSGNNGGYFISFTKRVDQTTKYFVSKIDESGAAEWETEVGSLENFRPYVYPYLYQASTNDLYMICFDQEKNVFLYKLDESGMVQWELDLGISSTRAFRGGVVETTDGELKICLDAPENPVYNSKLVSVSPSGELLNMITIGETNSSLYVTDMVLADDGHLVIVGRSTIAGTVRATVAKYTLVGDLIWEYIFEDNDLFYSWFRTIEKRDSNYFIGGYAIRFDDMAPMFAKFSDDGTPEFLKVGDEQEALNTYFNYGLHIDQNNVGYLVGHSRSESDISGAFYSNGLKEHMMSWDIESGEIKNVESFDVGRGASLLSSCVSSEGCSVLFGHRFIGNSGDLFVAKYGCDGLSSTTTSLQKSFDYTVFPNPTTEGVQIDFKSPLVTDAVINIYDINGTLLLEKNIVQQALSVSINLSEFAAGNYFIVVTDDQFKQTKLIVKQ